jgi:ketosteroid isomerase-like protein
MDANGTRELAEQFIQRLLRLEREGEAALDELVALFADDAELVNPGLKLAGAKRTGRAELRRFWQTYRQTLGEAESRFVRVTTNDDAAGLFWTTRASGRAGEQPIAYDGSTLLVFDEDGRIARFRTYFDRDDLSRAAPAETNEPATERGGVDDAPPSARDPRQQVSYG